MYTHNIDDPGLPGNIFRAPSKVSCLKTQCTVFYISTACADAVDTLRLGGRRKPGVGRLATELELALFAVVSTLGTGR